MFNVMLKKELRRVFTDKRLIFSSFILPAISIFLVYTIMGIMASNMVDNVKEHRASVYVQNSPVDFRDYYNTLSNEINMNVKYIESDKVESIKNSILIGEVDLLVEFEDNFQEKTVDYINREIPPEIKTYYNPSEEYSRDARANFINEVLAGYKEKILGNRFGDINYATAFVIDRTNDEGIIINEEKAKGKALSMVIPMLIGIILFSSAMGIGMDTIAGEKERGTMATLLLTPVKRETIALGKVAGLAVVAIISALCSFIGILASMPFASNMLVANGGGMPEFTLWQYVQLLFIMLTLVGLNVGVICLLSVRAQSVKEAGTYVAPVFMLVMVAAFSTMFTSGTPEVYKFAVPVYGSILAIKALLNFELGMVQFFVSIISSIVVTLILVKAITNSFNNEKIMLNP